MQKPTHYIEVTAMSLDGEALTQADQALVISQVMDAVHRHIENGHEVTVSFPQMSFEPVMIGGKLRIFGDVAALAAFLAEAKFAALVASAACVVGRHPLREVPQDVSWITYSRERSYEKTTKAFVERARKRRECRETQPSENSVRPIRKPAPYFRVTSQSNGGQFKVFLKATEVEGFVASSVSGYGLTVPVPVF
jgi:CRISPR-associated endoribonuclease Cas6/Csy4 subtype I-F